ncbi:MAG TPA: hypothetical protein VGD45_08515 [Steroidobacter sp.]|uniref:hypothetical protein n=1 Tax=Steroidobacter sp. TaxID=1978227 RepID=UPI002ED7C256
MKIAGCVIVALALVAIFQPWSYDRRGFAEVSVAVPGGAIDFSLMDQANSKAYCLTSTFQTKDPAGEVVSISIDRIGTASAGALYAHLAKSGTTTGLDIPQGPISFFEGPGVRKLVFPSDEAVEVTGAIQYKGGVHRFQTSLQLVHWEKNRDVRKYCV